MIENRGRGGFVKVFKVSPKQKKSIPGLSQRSTFFSEVKELENKGAGWCKCQFFQQRQIGLMETMLCFFLTNHLQAVVDLFMFHGHVVEVNKPESLF